MFFKKDIGKVVSYNKNEVIANIGQECKYVYFVLEGEVNIYTYTSLEDTYTIASIKKGSLFGAILLFSESPYFLGNIVTTKKTILRIINKKELLENFEDQDFLKEYLGHVSTLHMRLQNRLKVLSQKSIRGKILFYLHSKKRMTSNNVIPIRSIKTFSEFLNIPRPSVSRELIKMQDENLIEYTKKYIVLLD